MDISCFSPLWGTWEIDALIGQGSYGKVYRAKRVEYDKIYYSAVKHISIPSSKNEVDSLFADGVVSDAQSLQAYYGNLLQRLLREIDINVSLKGHTNIVSYEDHMVVPKKDGPGYDVFIRMELLTPLPQLLQQRAITEQEVKKLGADICSALEVMARYNILHRDIKPSNIFVSDGGEFKIGDFGVSRTLDSATNGVTIAGTLNYMAPELNRGQHVSLKSDLYSLGLVLYRLCNANRGPFVTLPPEPVTADMLEASNSARFSGKPLPAPVYASPELASVILRACEYDPQKRFENAGEMRRALLGSPAPDFGFSGKSPEAPAASPDDKPEKPEKSSRFWLVPVFLVGIVIIAIIAVIFILSFRLITGRTISIDASPVSPSAPLHSEAVKNAEPLLTAVSGSVQLAEDWDSFVIRSEGIDECLNPDSSYYCVTIPQFLETNSDIAALNNDLLAAYDIDYTYPVIVAVDYYLTRHDDVCSVVVTKTYAERVPGASAYENLGGLSTFHPDYETTVRAFHFNEASGEYITSAELAELYGWTEEYIVAAFEACGRDYSLPYGEMNFYLSTGDVLMFGGVVPWWLDIRATFHDYEIFSGDLTWHEANSRAQELGGHLITITSDEELEIASKLINAAGCKYTWLGGHTGFQPNGSVFAWWTTGETMPDKYWCTDQPSGVDNGITEDCILLWYLERDGGWTFNDVMTDPMSYVDYYNGNLSFIVEYGDGYTGTELP